MIRGGEGSFIGLVHRMAARLDGMIELICGAFSSDPAVSEATGKSEGLDNERSYADWHHMISPVKTLPDEIRPHFISIVTPFFPC